MDVYSSFVFKGKSKLKIELVGEKKNNDLYSGWEINKISSEFNEIYYKSELLRTIEELIKSGTNPSDIWIFNKSIDIKKKYVNYKTGNLYFSNPKDIEYLYYLGSPTPLYTNKKVMLLSITFDAFRSIYSICNKHNIGIPSRVESLKSILQDLNSNQLTNLIEYFKSIVFENNDLKDSQLIDTINLEINHSLRGFSNDFKELLNADFTDNINFPKKIAKYDNFNSIFSSYERPVIVVNNSSTLNEQTTEVSILCSDFLVSEKFKKSNPRFLETNLISQNSPLIYAVTLGITMIPSLILILKKRRDLLAAKRENFESENGHESEINILDTKIAGLDFEINRLDTDNERNELQFTAYKQNNQISEIQNPNVAAALTIIDNNKKAIAIKGVEWLKQNNLELASHEKTDIG